MPDNFTYYAQLLPHYAHVTMSERISVLGQQHSVLGQQIQLY